ncbi:MULTISPECIES: carbohydrate ABC transporter permease [unclassified Paenibacillus]|uniref:carbohydrate ABC transporter permease n=1 Tax=unclassified Paenibacillus TaxID=185978 RepID=UPI0036339C19
MDKPQGGTAVINYQQSRMMKKNQASFLAGFLVLPAAVIVFVAMIVPLVYALFMSFFQYGLGQESKAVFVFFDNYVRFFKDQTALHSLWNTFLFMGMALCLELLLGIGIAVLLTTIPAKLANFMRALFTMPLLISHVIVGLIWRYMYDPTYGLVYYVLSWFGLESFGGLQKTSTALFSIVIADAWHATPFLILVVSAGLTSIPHDLYEAAKIDGAGAFQTLTKITLPMLSKVIIVITLIRGTDAFRVFDIIFALTGGGPANSTSSLSIYAYKQAFENNEMGYAMAVSVITLVGLLLIFGSLMKNSASGKAG